jgi:hypothetical protein
MNTISDITNITWCNIAQIIGESNRFLFHVVLVHTATIIIEGKREYLSKEFFSALVVTMTAIVMYHLFFRKIVEPKIEKMNLVCYTGIDKHTKRKKLLKQYPILQNHDVKTYNKFGKAKQTKPSRKTEHSKPSRKTEHSKPSRNKKSSR